MPPRWAGMNKHKLEEVHNIFACTNTLCPECYTHLSGRCEDIADDVTRERERKIQQLTK
jgi:hypothetical protein